MHCIAKPANHANQLALSWFKASILVMETPTLPVGLLAARQTELNQLNAGSVGGGLRLL